MKKRRFILNLPNGYRWHFYAESWDHAQDIIFDCLELEEADRPLTREEYLDNEADMDRKEAS